MTDRELMQQALEALDGYARNCRCEGGGAPCDAAEALRARLLQPEPKPVAIMQQEAYGRGQMLWLTSASQIQDGTPLYTAPPQREWQGLTMDELDELVEAHGDNKFTLGMVGHVFAIDVEAKLKEKNSK